MVYCSRCGTTKIDRNGWCEKCLKKKELDDIMWSQLKCHICSRPAILYNINGAACNNPAHYPVKSVFDRFGGNGFVGMVVE